MFKWHLDDISLACLTFGEVQIYPTVASHHITEQFSSTSSTSTLFSHHLGSKRVMQAIVLEICPVKTQSNVSLWGNSSRQWKFCFK